MIAGVVYCSVISACHDAVRSASRAGMDDGAGRLVRGASGHGVRSAGQCLIRRSELMQLHGEWQDAIGEAQRACEWLAHARQSSPMPAAPITSRPSCIGCAATSRRRTTATDEPARPDASRIPAWRCFGWRRARSTPPMSAIRRDAAGDPRPARARPPAGRRRRDHARTGSDLTARAQRRRGAVADIAGELDAPFLRAAAASRAGAVALPRASRCTALHRLLRDVVDDLAGARRAV